MVRHVEARQASQGVVQRDATLRCLRWFGHVHRRRRWLTRNAGEILLHLFERRPGIDVADDRDDRIVGGIVHLEEVGHVLHSSGAQIGHGPDDGMRIRVIRVGGLGKDVTDLSVRNVVHTEPTLFLDGVDLILEIVRRDRERPHSIGLEEQREGDLICRQRFVVECAILVRRAIHAAAIHEHQIGVFSLPDIL
jgi:hypothetical protein